MIRHRPCCVVIAILLAASTVNLPPAAAQVTVYDPQNHAQTLLTAARALQQVNNQLTALQNQASMLRNQARDLQALDYSSLAPLKDAMQQLDGLMAKAKGMAFDVASTEQVLNASYGAPAPNASTRQLIERARSQAETALEGYRQALRVQAQVVENVRGDGPLIETLISKSQGAEGQLQALQAANQLQALAVKQDQQLQTLMAAQYRADALERARQAQAIEAGKAAARRFVGRSDAPDR